ncbi:folate-binding protein YgfZ [Massilia sp. 9I]|uniref:CAF17-like 4Fe-4S cluster assembly/insertion protein YgfZ n=1 Tax=Massilia sp. 9I TaxID=2653152 RepID=UPI0012F0C82E|nr:folate-binding protein [Massilia sp. 9I]VXB73857.1 Folate-dependent protein for Fe/S cluster synthesis/repair in oxidative stress [Massilia sp. 9I]
MSNWTDTLSSLGARFHIDEAAQVEDFGRALSAAELADGFVATVTDLGIIAVAGEDAASFLHNQLTNDVEHLGQAEARLAGYCTPKGRLQATFLYWRSSEENRDAVYLQLPRTIQPPLQKRLTMFVLRAKAKLRDATEEAPFAAVLGLGGAKGETALRRHVNTLPDAPYGKVSGEFGTVIRLADVFGAPRYLWFTSAETATAALPGLSGELALGGNQAWHLAAIHAGVPQVTAATQEQFVPQMVNLELLGGVNFKKGCYPGQEIVARSQYLGKLKRRTALATVANPAARAGDEVFSMVDPGQPCGMVVNAAANGLGGADLLVEMKLDALGEDVRHGVAGGPALAFQHMPYHLDAIDI